jgi:hypothetical protein
MTTHNLKDSPPRVDLARDLFFPIILFAALGGMTWAVRGSSGFGGSAGCAFAGLLWGVGWWFISREPSGIQSRPYSSGWIVLALTLGIGISGDRGWMQWSSFFEGRLQTDYSAGEFVPISPAYGFLWLFIAGMPWAGIGACCLAWCGSSKETRWHHWLMRIGCGIAGIVLARVLFESLPNLFLPLYETHIERYRDLEANPNLRRLINDNRNAITHMGAYLGLLGYEVGRRDWRNAVLIVTVGVLNGLGWAICQNWKWAYHVWPESNFNWWRCWESCGGLSIGIAYGVAFFLVNRKVSEAEKLRQPELYTNRKPNLERFGLAAGILFGLGFALINGIKGWANIYLGNEEFWEGTLWMVIGPVIPALILLAGLLIRKYPLPEGYPGDAIPRAYALVWLVLIVQNILGQMVTGPPIHWNEVVFNIYYLILFILSAVVLHHYRTVKRFGRSAEPSLS